MAPGSGTRVVLIGGGHANQYSLLHGLDLRRAGAELVLVAPQPYHYYSGMGPGMLGGIYSPEEIRIDVRRLVQAAGGRFVAGWVKRIDPERKRLLLADGETLHYDILACNTGSRVRAGGIQGAEDGLTPAKPAENLVRLREQLCAGGPGVRRVVGIGGGPSGVEIAGNLRRLALSRGAELGVTLLHRGERLLEEWPERAGRLARRNLERRGVAVRLRCGVRAVGQGMVFTEAGETYPFDQGVLAAGIAPQGPFVDSGLPTAPDGALRVDEFLRCSGRPEIFAGGDCARLRGRRLPRVGVVAVRQAPVIHANILATLQGRPPRPYRPQRRFLLILNLGDGRGLATRGGLVLHGRAMFRLKEYLDRSYTRRFV
jgi:NADH dehydrogenase FAD-containing subunit